jgi:hypothetical protein
VRGPWAQEADVVDEDGEWAWEDGRAGGAGDEGVEVCVVP